MSDFLIKRKCTEEYAAKVAAFPRKCRDMYLGLIEAGAKWVPNPSEFDPKHPEDFEKVLKSYWRSHCYDVAMRDLLQKEAASHEQRRLAAELEKRRAESPQKELF